MIGQSGRGDDRHRTYTRLPPDRRGRRSLRRSLRRLLRRRSPPSPLVPPFAIPSQLVAIPVAISVAISVRRNFRRNFRSSRFPFVAILVRAISFVAIPFVPVPGLLRGRGRSIVRRNFRSLQFRSCPCPGCSEAEAVRSFVAIPLTRARSTSVAPGSHGQHRSPVPGVTRSGVARAASSRFRATLVAILVRNFRSSQFPFVAIPFARRTFARRTFVRRNFRSCNSVRRRRS